MNIRDLIRPIYHLLIDLNPRTLYWRSRVSKCGKRVTIGKNVSMHNPQFITLGDNVILDHHVSLFVNPICSKAQLIIGNGVLLGKYNDFGCSNEIIIEDKVITAPFVHITDRDHCYENINIPIMDQVTKSKGSVIIKEGCWIGFGVQIMSGVTIGKQSVVAAGSIVTKDIPAYSVAAGNPAKIIKQYNQNTHKWEKL